MRGIREYIAETMALPKDVMLDLPRVSICGDKEVYVENHKGLGGCTDTDVTIKMNGGLLHIHGEKLRIIAFRSDYLVINGEFEGVSYEKIGRKSKNVQKNL